MIANIISSSHLLTLLYFIVTSMLVLDLFTLSNCLLPYERVIIVLHSLMLQYPIFIPNIYILHMMWKSVNTTKCETINATYIVTPPLQH